MPTPLSERPTFLGTLTRLYQRTYLADYLGFLLLQTLYFLTRYLLTPVHRQFRLSDPAIQHPHADPERVPSWENVIYAGFIPLGILVLVSAVGRVGWHKAHVSILGLLISISLTSFNTHLVKNAIGRPRPDLIARCIPALGTPGDEWVSIEVCTNPDVKILNDGWRSFPSGHSSFAFSGLGYLTLYLAGQLHTFRSRVDLARVLVTFAPVVGAMLIAMSRMSDYRHDVYDVSVGGVLGMGVAGFAYRRYFRGLREGRCEEPWPSPLADVSAWRTRGGGEERVGGPPKDEEEEVGMGGEVSAGEFDLDDLTEDEAERGGLLDGKHSGSPRGKQRDEGNGGGGSER